MKSTVEQLSPTRVRLSVEVPFDELAPGDSASIERVLGIQDIQLFALLSGALADLFDRRRLMLIALAVMTIMSVALAVLTYMGGVRPWSLLIFTFAIGLGQAIYNPPWQASMGDLVSRDDLPSAVTLNSVGFNLMRSVGPAAGGFIVREAPAA